METVVVLRGKARNRNGTCRVYLNSIEGLISGVAPDEKTRDGELLAFDPCYQQTTGDRLTISALPDPLN